MGATEAGNETLQTTGRSRRPVAIIHGCAAVAIMATAAAGRLPFVPMYDPLEARPTWLGLTTTWVLVTLVYVGAWTAYARASKLAELFVFVALIVSSIWAGWVVITSAVQVAGVGVSPWRFTAGWWLQLAAAAAVLCAMAFLVRERTAPAVDLAENEPEEDAYGHRDALPLPLRLPAFAAGALAVAVVGFVLNAWMLALLATPTATQAQAVEAVQRAVADVRPVGINAFQGDVDETISRESRTKPRDRWLIVQDLFDYTGPAAAAKDLLWPIQVGYREQLTCVAAIERTQQVVVLPGPCPR